MVKERLNLNVSSDTRKILKKYVPNISNLIDAVAQRAIEQDKNFETEYKEQLKECKSLCICQECKQQKDFQDISLCGIFPSCADELNLDIPDTISPICSNCLDLRKNVGKRTLSLREILEANPKKSYFIVPLCDFISGVCKEKVNEAISKDIKAKMEGTGV